MTTLLAYAAHVADDLATGNHTVVLDWLEDCEMHYRQNVPVGLRLPVRCIDCTWDSSAYIEHALTQQAVDIAVADMGVLHNRTRPKDDPR